MNSQLMDQLILKSNQDQFFQPDFILAKVDGFEQKQRSTGKKSINSCANSECETTEDSDHENQFQGSLIYSSDNSGQKQYSNNYEFSHSSILQSQQNSNSNKKSQNPLDQVKYKTEMCRNWEIYHQCNYGAKCRYAHGMHELKGKINVNQYYRTRKCKLYHEQGYCSYGTRCHFIHEMKHHDENFKRPAKQSYGDMMEWGLTLGKRLDFFSSIAPEEENLQNNQNKNNSILTTSNSSYSSQNSQENQVCQIFSILAPNQNQTSYQQKELFSNFDKISSNYQNFNQF